jgi:hypothetical protein
MVFIVTAKFIPTHCMDAIASGTISLAGTTMFKVRTVSDLNANAKQEQEQDLVDAGSYQGLAAQHVQDTIDTVGSHAALVAEHLRVAFDEIFDGSIRKRALIPEPATQVVWNTLEELREVALSEGCTVKQIGEAIEAADADPCKAARILHQHLVLSYLRSKRSATSR